MLRPFQVNVGRFLHLDRDVSPTARVSELCEAIEVSSGEDANSQVLLASDGKQMNPSELIGAYSVGTESKPVFVFYRSHLMSHDPPATPTLLPHRGDLQQQLDLLRHKPTPTLFQKQVALAKRLSEHSARVSQACSQLAEEYQLQCSGWKTVLSNCNSIIKMYQKHQVLFSKSIEGFTSSKQHFLKLLQDFPAQVKLLQQLPVPSALQSEDTPTSLYDWISTHDEKNSLQDLGAECQRSLAKVDSDRIDATLQSSQQILATVEGFFSQENHMNDVTARLRSLAEQSVSTMDTQMGLAQNIQSTSERALRSGDGGTIADLVLSHHKSLQLMADYCQQIETSVREMEGEKVSLTRHIHTKLRQVTEIQKKVADSNSQLVLLHEHVKLAKKRFEILEQVCSTPQVLARVLSEVERRRMYSSSLEKKTGEVSLLLRRAREEEKMLRKSFVNVCGQHFLLTLFPELQDRVPDITVHLPKSLTKSTVSTEKDLESIRHLLPEDIRASSAELCSSVKLLASTTTVSVSEANTNEISSQTDSSENTEPLQAAKDALDLGLVVRDSLTETATPTDSSAQLEGTLEQRLTQCTSELESVTKELLLTREQVSSERENSEKVLSELQTKNSELSAKVEQLVKENEDVRLEMEEQCKEAEKRLAQAELEKEQLLSKADQAGARHDNLTSDLEQYKLKNEELANLLQQQEATIRDNTRQSEHELNEKQNLEELVSQLKTSNIELVSKRESLELSLSQTLARSTQSDEVCVRLETETKRLDEELQRLSKELEKTQFEKEVLITQANQAQDLTHMSQMLQKWEAEVGHLKQELNIVNSKLRDAEENVNSSTSKLSALKKEFEVLTVDHKSLKSEGHRQELRHQQAQMTIVRLRTQLEAAITKNEELTSKAVDAERRAKENLSKLHNIEGNVAAKNNSASAEERLELCERHKREAERRAEMAERRAEMAERRAEMAESKVKVMESKISEYNLQITKLEDVLSAEKKEKEKLTKELEEALIDSDGRRKETEKMLEESEQRQKESFEKLSGCLTENTLLKSRLSDVENERDSHMKRGMEMERALKEVRRDVGQTSPTLTHSGTSDAVAVQKPAITTLTASTTSKVGILVTASIGSLQVGDNALFIRDQYGNYLALTMDEKTYYLNQTSTAQLEDLALKNQKLNLRRKILFGKLTGKVLVEVRKESNRLHVPVGERLYKVDAEACS